MMNRIVEAAHSGRPLYLLPYKEPKVWGIDGIGEYWYGAETGPKSSIAKAAGQTAPMADVVANDPKEILGEYVVQKFGQKLPLVKILTPKGRLSVQFHDAKDELWIVTGIDGSLAGEKACIILGFSQEAVEKHGAYIIESYRQALESYGKVLNSLIDLLEFKGHQGLLEEKKDVALAAEEVEDPDIERYFDEFNTAQEELNSFYNYRPVEVGDVIPIPSGTLHALGAGIKVVEPQIPGPTQSMEDGATYPVRYFFPGYSRKGAKKELDIFRVKEVSDGVTKEASPEVIKKTEAFTVEKLPGGFEKKGLAVNRVTIEKGREMEVPPAGSFHNLVVVRGKAGVMIGDEWFKIPKAEPGGEMMIIPATNTGYRIVSEESGTQVIDTFSPLQ
ncbi:MAG: type I phosphomannose isomerase catalytic subunit [Candidatus Omnitrophota bacterium]